MLFDENPKKIIADLFGRESDIKILEDMISVNRKLTIISGTRRIGKSSLKDAVLNQEKYKTISIDMASQEIPEDFSANQMLQIFQGGTKTFMKKYGSKTYKLINFGKKIREIKIGGSGASLHKDDNPELMKEHFDELNKWAKKNGKIILALDEIQDLRNTKKFNIANILYHIFEHCDNILMVVSGSEAGMLYEIFAFDDPSTKSKFHGRSKGEIPLKPLSDKVTKDFLMEGFKEIKFNVNQNDEKILDKAVELLGGIIGWQISFAKKCVDAKTISENFINEIQIDGSQRAKFEYEKFLSTQPESERENYNKLLKILAIPPAIKFRDEAEKPINEKFIKLLKREGIIDFNDNQYYFQDPLLAFCFRTGKI